MSDRPTTRPPAPFDARPRAITPLAEFDTRPKTGDPADPFDGIPHLSAPRMPTGVEMELRDTDHDEVTPAGPKEDTLDMVLKRLGELDAKVSDSIVGNQRCYDLLIIIQAEHREHRRGDRKRRVALARRVTALELSRQWVPAVAWLVVMVLVLFALLRTYR